MIIRHRFNWLCPPFRPLVLGLLDELESRLPPPARDVLERQRQAINYVSYVLNDVMFYEVKGWELAQRQASPFPLTSDDAHLATMAFQLPQEATQYKADFWLVRGGLFQLTITPEPTEHWKRRRVSVTKFKQHVDPMRPEEQTPLVRVFVALGSNLGDSVQIVSEATNWLAGLSHAPVRSSSLWLTAPVDCPADSARFVNSVIELSLFASESPEDVLLKLREIETEFGRQPKTVLNEARPLDLDLIAWGDEVRNTPTLILPHPRAHLRHFVLCPLCELAPDLVLPGQHRTVAELLAALGPATGVQRMA
jgi:2-amino-4-hydroxy-6-hydroxymethyldihydropteridine diphosphokinase